MSQCEKTPKCPFVNDQMAKMPSIAEALKRKYCMQSKETCARFQVGAAGVQVPATLFPSDLKEAAALVAAKP